MHSIAPDYSIWIITEDAAVVYCSGVRAQDAPSGELAISEFAFLPLTVSLFLSLSLLRNPGLTHAILICLLRDNHDPEEEKRSSNPRRFISSFIHDSSDLLTIINVFVKYCSVAVTGSDDRICVITHIFIVTGCKLEIQNTTDQTPVCQINIILFDLLKKCKSHWTFVKCLYLLANSKLARF